jgi:hypothetical protein
VRSALGTLPWVEQATIQTDVNRREVRFNLADRSRFSAAEVKQALGRQGFAQADVTAGPT